MAADLEMVLRQGITVNRYIYCDKNPTARAIAHHRLLDLSAAYGPHFSQEAWQEAFTTVPQNVRDMNVDHFTAAGAAKGTQWIVFAGWNYAGLTLEGSRSEYCAEKAKTFIPMLQVVGELQKMQQALLKAFPYSASRKRPQHMRQLQKHWVNQLCWMLPGLAVMGTNSETIGQICATPLLCNWSSALMRESQTDPSRVFYVQAQGHRNVSEDTAAKHRGPTRLGAKRKCWVRTLKSCPPGRQVAIAACTVKDLDW
jgi:hypothetical protein